MENDVERRNRKLLVKGDDTEIYCEMHNVTRRFGDLDPMIQIAVLNGWDVEGDKCIMDKGQRP